MRFQTGGLVNYMKILKYAGLCVAGLVMNIALILIDAFVCARFDSILFSTEIVFVLIALGFCIGSAFIHVKLMNLIRKKLVMRSRWYLISVFIAPVVLGGLGVILALVLGETIWSGWAGLGNVVTMFFCSIIWGIMSMFSGISTVCLNSPFGALEPEKANLNSRDDKE